MMQLASKLACRRGPIILAARRPSYVASTVDHLTNIRASSHRRWQPLRVFTSEAGPGIAPAFAPSNESFVQGEFYQPPTDAGEFRIYKGKAALELSLILPRIAQGPRGKPYVESQGKLLLQMAPALGQQDDNNKYNWNSKATFALDACEAAIILEYPDESHSFLHDPGMKSAEQGMTTKTLQIAPNAGNAGKGIKDKTWFINLTVKTKGDPHSFNGSNDTKLMIPVSASEMATLKQVIAFCVPRMLGFGLS